MKLNYDYDIHDVAGDEIYAVPEFANLMESIGIHQNSAGNKVPQFRKQATMDAMNARPPSLRAMFKDAGFATIASHH